MYGEEILASEHADFCYQLNEQQRWLKERIWVTKDYREIPVCDMTNDHLINSLNALKRGGLGHFYDYHNEAIVMLAGEAVRRGLLEGVEQ